MDVGVDERALWPETVELALRRIARLLVGRMDLKQAMHLLRACMVEEALRGSGGSRRSAARLLGVSRPAIQRILRECPEINSQ